jgi:hypothetical protein
MKTLIDNWDVNEVIANWSVNPEIVLSVFGIECKLEPVDWQPIKEFSFGVLGYDYEEGLRFETSIDQLANIVSWILVFHFEYHISLLDSEGYAMFSCMFVMPIRKPNDLEDNKFKLAGLTRSKECDFEWELRPEEHIFNCRQTLSRKCLMSLPTGIYLVSNYYKMIQPDLYTPRFSEYVVSLKERNNQWERIKLAGADHGLCTVYHSIEECRQYLEGLTERLKGHSKFVLYEDV